MTAGQFAVLWVLNNALVTATIAGPRTEAQWDGYAAVLDYKLTAADEALIDRWCLSARAMPVGPNGRPKIRKELRA